MNARFAGGLMVSMMIAGMVCAAPVDKERATAAAQTYISFRFPARQGERVMTSTRLGKSAFAVTSVVPVSWSNRTVGFVASLEPEGFLLLRADDAAPPLKIYSEHGSFAGLRPSRAQGMLWALAAELDEIAAPGSKTMSPYTAEWAALVRPDGNVAALSNHLLEAEIGPLLETFWGEDAPYNNFSPSNMVSKAPAGSAAVSLAQILRHHQKPAQVIAEYSYTDNNGALRGTHRVSDATFTPYDWSNMPPMISAGSTETEIFAVAQLVYHCGVVVNTDYEMNISSGQISTASIRQYFNYTTGDLDRRPATANYSQWYQKCYNDIYNNRPIWYMFPPQFYLDDCEVVDGVRNGNELHMREFGYGYWYNIAGGAAAIITNEKAIFQIDPPGGAIPLLPTPPVSISASDSQSVQSVTVSWPACERATKYAVFRNTVDDPSTAVEIMTDITGTTYDDTTMEIGPEFYYWFKAGNARGWTDFSPSDLGSALLLPPDKPSGVDASDGSSTTSVTVDWPATLRATSYAVLRGTTTNAADAIVLADVIPTNTYDDATAATEVTYWYWVLGSNMTGAGELSDPDIGYCADPLLKPDLAIQNVRYTPGIYATGNVVNVSFAQLNQGTAAVPAPRPFSTRASLLRQDGTRLTLTSMTYTAGYAIGQSNVVACAYTIPGNAPRGAYTLKIEADFGENVGETNEDNNIGFTGNDDVIIAVLDPKDNARINNDGLVFINSSKLTNWWIEYTNTFVDGQRWRWTMVRGLGPKDSLTLSAGKKVKQTDGTYVYSYEHTIPSNSVVVMDNGAKFLGSSMHGMLGGLLLGTMPVSNACWESFVPMTPEKSFSIKFPGSKDATKASGAFALAGINIVICRNIKKIDADFVRRVAGDSTIGGMQIVVKGDKTIQSGHVGGSSTQDVGWIGVPTNFPNTTVRTLMGTGTVVKSVSAAGLIDNLNMYGTGLQKNGKDAGKLTASNKDKVDDAAIGVVHTNVWKGWKSTKGVKLGP